MLPLVQASTFREDFNGLLTGVFTSVPTQSTASVPQRGQEGSVSKHRQDLITPPLKASRAPHRTQNQASSPSLEALTPTSPTSLQCAALSTPLKLGMYVCRAPRRTSPRVSQKPRMQRDKGKVLCQMLCIAISGGSLGKKPWL